MNNEFNINHVIVFVSFFFSTLALSQENKKNLLILDYKGEEIENINVSVIFNYENGDTSSFKKENIQLEVEKLKFLNSISIIVEKDTLSFYANNEAMFDGMNELRDKYKIDYVRNILSSPATWKLYIDSYPYHSLNGINHLEIFSDKIDKCLKGIVYHLRLTNSELVFRCKG